MAAHTALGNLYINSTSNVLRQKTVECHQQKRAPSLDIPATSFRRQPSLRISHRTSHSCNRHRHGTQHFRSRCLRVAGLVSAEIGDESNEKLKDAAKAGDLQTVKEILESSQANIDVPSAARGGWTALHLACFYGHPAIVQSLLKAGANLEVRNESGNTPLQLASIKGNINIAQMLLESGADMYAESLDKGTALDYAQEWGGEEMVDYLLLWAAKSSLNS